LAVEMKIGTGDSHGPLISAVESSGDDACGVDLDVQLDVQRAEHACVVAGDGGSGLRGGG
jgi:hypothetical protein